MVIRARRPVVAVGVDETSEAMEALRYGAAVARDRHWDLCVVRAYQLPVGITGLTAAEVDQVRQAAEAVVDAALSGLYLGSTTTIERLVQAGSPAAVLHDASMRASMLVLGRHHFSLEDQLVGRIGAAAAAHAACPVVIVPPRWGRIKTDRRPVMVALDGESSAQPALSAACDEAELRGTKLIAMHTVPPRGEESFASEEQAALGELVAGAKQDHPDLQIETLLLNGEPRQQILAGTVQAGLVVVGRPHRRHGVGSWSHSVARAVMNGSRCPLLIAPPLPPDSTSGVRALSRSRH